MYQLSFFDKGYDLKDSIEQGLESLRHYRSIYPDWAVAYSGGKDSTALVTFVVWAIQNEIVERPDNLLFLYADTRQEYPPLHQTALSILNHLKNRGFETQVVLPRLDERFYTYILGRGVPPPHNHFRWCTRLLKIEPMTRVLEQISTQTGRKFLVLNGLRLGESNTRDGRILAACDKDSGECGQGWLEVKPPSAAADTLAPLLNWRLCHVFDWIYFESDQHGFSEAAQIATVYGDRDVRTGCIACRLVQRDIPLERLVQLPKWSHLAPLLELTDLFDYLREPGSRLMKHKTQNAREGQLGPLTFEARQVGLDTVLDIQCRAKIDLINSEEETRIRWHWKQKTWPSGWDGTEPVGDSLLPQYKIVNSQVFRQDLLV